jgi:uncharacterized lipoprotein YajG
MTATTSHLSHGLALALIAGTALLAGCGPTPVTRTTTTTEETTTKPVLQPAASSTTTTETQQFR